VEVIAVELSDGAGEIVFVVRGPVARQDVPGVCARLGEQLARHDDGTTVVVDAHELGPANAAALELLARIRLTAGRRPVRFENVPRRVRELVEWVGLGHLLHVELQVEQAGAPAERAGRAGLRVEAERHVEEREEVRGLRHGGVGGQPAEGGLDGLLGLRRQEDGDVAHPPPGDL
jgi:ABC-type transporter Mla MlaB component